MNCLLCRNNMVPTKKHLEIALGEFSAEGKNWNQQVTCGFQAATQTFCGFIGHPVLDEYNVN